VNKGGRGRSANNGKGELAQSALLARELRGMAEQMPRFELLASETARGGRAKARFEPLVARSAALISSNEYDRHIRLVICAP